MKVIVSDGKIFGWILTVSLFCTFNIISGQKIADYTGTWIMDMAKSDANYNKFYSAITFIIRQGQSEITVERSSTGKNGKLTKQDPLTCSPDGKELSKEQFGGVDRYSAGWSGIKPSTS